MGRPKKAKLIKRQKITKEFRDDLHKTSAIHKKTIIPGPWTNIDSDLNINPKFKKHISLYSKLGSYDGLYVNDPGNEKGWYNIVFNLCFDNMDAVVKKYGLDKVLAACEKELTNQHKYGTIIILSANDNSQNPDPAKRFISCRAKTNKKSIAGFAANRLNELVVLGRADPKELK